MARVLAITSGGGHWDEMMVLRESLGEIDVVYANTFDGLAKNSGVANCHVIADCNRNAPMSVLRCALDVLSVIRRERPDIIISTGAAPGALAIMIGKLLGCRTIWVDSIANSIELSMSGRMVGRFADLWLTQWKHLAREKGPQFWGNIL